MDSHSLCSHRSHRRLNWLALAVGLIGFTAAFAFQIGPAIGIQIDFFIYYSGVKRAWSGVSPYDISWCVREVEASFPPQPGEPTMEAGFFLSPQGFALLSPWTILPWHYARWIWVATSAFGATLCGLLAGLFGRDPAFRGWGWGLIVVAILLNPLTLRAVSLGQTGLFVIGCVVLGQFFRERGRPLLATLFWSGCGLKPHLGLALIIFTAYQGGYRRAATVAGAVVIGVIIGASVLGNPLTVILEYVRYLGPAHQSVGFNRITNDQILSWNRIVLACGGPAIELTAPGVIAGFAVAIGLLWAVQVRGQTRPSDSWALAATVAWTPLVTPLHGYELVAWTLMVPYLCLLYDRRRWADFAFLLAMFGIVSIPRGAVASLSAGFPAVAPLVLSYRSVVVLVVALYYLIRKPPSLAIVAVRVLDVNSPATNRTI
ncbi:hypothetical protein BH11PLA2_BH11PLA2_10260 [soil metagenome]